MRFIGTHAGEGPLPVSGSFFSGAGICGPVRGVMR